MLPPARFRNIFLFLPVATGAEAIAVWPAHESDPYSTEMDYINLNKLWSFRSLALTFLQREIKSRYVGSVSGLFWILIHPLALLGIYSVVFATIFKVTPLDLGGYGFVAFVALALWPWLAFQEGGLRGALAIQANAGLIKKVAFPNELLVYGAVCATYVVHGIGFMAALVVLVISGNALHLETLPLVGTLLLVQLLFTLGFAMVLAALQVMLKDVEHFLSPFMMIWFYATPVLYSAAMIPVKYRLLMSLNPMSYFIGRIRELLMHGGGILLSDGTALLGSLFVFLLGRWFFNRLAPHFEDFL